jgi:hypothetical protein
MPLGAQGSDSRHDGCRGTSGHISLFHGFSEFLLHVRCEIISLPRIGLGRILESDRPTAVHDRLDCGTTNHLVGHLGGCI